MNVVLPKGVYSVSGETAIFSIHDKKDYEIHEIVQQVYDALKEKGYNPVNQLVGYILSEDPTYITTYKNARSMTHVYNGMSPFAHRANGLVGAAYRIRTMYGEIICDGCHSTPAALNNYFMSKGPDYAIMISDALMAKGTPIGSEYIFGGNHITIYPDGSAHLDNGTLAGSTLNINKGLRILVEEAMVPFNYALNACTINPARCLHLDDRKGSRKGLN